MKHRGRGMKLPRDGKYRPGGTQSKGGLIFGGLISGWLITGIVLCLHIDGPITERGLQPEFYRISDKFHVAILWL